MKQHATCAIMFVQAGRWLALKQMSYVGVILNQMEKNLNMIWKLGFGDYPCLLEQAMLASSLASSSRSRQVTVN